MGSAWSEAPQPCFVSDVPHGVQAARQVAVQLAVQLAVQVAVQLAVRTSWSGNSFHECSSLSSSLMGASLPNSPPYSLSR